MWRQLVVRIGVDHEQESTFSERFGKGQLKGVFKLGYLVFAAKGCDDGCWRIMHGHLERGNTGERKPIPGDKPAITPI
jgi:hypothetical protein